MISSTEKRFFNCLFHNTSPLNRFIHMELILCSLTVRCLLKAFVNDDHPLQNLLKERKLGEQMGNDLWE